jgi:hypothetical protein
LVGSIGNAARDGLDFLTLDISTPPRALILRAAKCGCIREMSVGFGADDLAPDFAVFPPENRRRFSYSAN